MHRNGRNKMEDGEAVAGKPDSCRTTDWDGPCRAHHHFGLLQ